MSSTALRAIDSNVILRYLLQDDNDHSVRATRLIDSEEPLGLTIVALAEIVWTLTGPRYRHDRTAVATGLIELLSRANIIAIGFNKVEAQATLLTCAQNPGRADFGDALITTCAQSAGVYEIYFARSGITVVSPG